ncbi:MAG: hypothetical protein ACT4OZ_04810 [Gemmatimonadota bacterium]
MIRLGITAATLSLLLAACATRQYRLEILGGSGQGLSRVTSDLEGEFGPSISPDGRVLLFDTRYARTAGVVGIDPTSGARRTVFTSTSSRAQEVAWDRAGKYFVYTSSSSGTGVSFEASRIVRMLQSRSSSAARWPR